MLESMADVILFDAAIHPGNIHQQRLLQRVPGWEVPENADEVYSWMTAAGE
ncbi:hypothetical protein [Halorhodospira halophila]|uniref:hypothetical protein n=1 Tax=Halorhodospira halophila TaxID=1053 RepID=UPI0002ED7FCC|nr:hypothetical protein [Halorhodospira halophila]